ncbi:MAG: transcription antitermination factor NusB [Deltaproteobacteria bacterium]|jgi:N utilization substance protein B|nr:transcription antitermination factor NusB [Deltaproteobacteria bacterium]
MHQRRKAREVALQVLYELDVLNIDAKEAIRLFWNNFQATEDSKKFSTLLIEGAWDNREQIDNLIRSCSEHWSLERMSRVDRNILRMAVYELLYCPNIPPKVTLNEAIDLGKMYGSENSGSFINGILDAVYLTLYRETMKQDVNGSCNS